MHEVELGLESEITPDAARNGLLHRVRSARELPECGDSAGALQMAATTGPEVMNSSSEPKNGLPSCSA